MMYESNSPLRTADDWWIKLAKAVANKPWQHAALDAVADTSRTQNIAYHANLNYQRSKSKHTDVRDNSLRFLDKTQDIRDKNADKKRKDRAKKKRSRSRKWD